MKKLLLGWILIACYVISFAQQHQLKGKIIDAETSESLVGATVKIKNSDISTYSNESGAFTLNLPSSNSVLIISHVGYQTRELIGSAFSLNDRLITISLTSIYKQSDIIVVSASRRPEKITNAPASIQVIGQKELSQFAGSNVGELAAYVQGVEFVRMGVDNVSYNARGLNNAFNNKVFQLIDGRNSMSPLSGSLMMGNNMSANKEDIEKVEILLGPQTALYGPNVHNALFNYITKDPRKYEGTTLAITAGNQNQFSGRFRQATKINDRWAYKFTGEYAVGEDFKFYDSVYVGGGVYGPALAVPERLDLNFRRLRGEAHVYYSMNPSATFIVSAGGSKNNTINTHTGGHNQFIGMNNQFVQARFTSPRIYATAYHAWAGFGDSYSALGYTRTYWNRTHSTITNKNDPRFATQGFLLPEEAEVVARVDNTFKESPQRFNAEVQYNYLFEKPKMFMVAGLTYQKDLPRGYGINLVDSFERIYVTQYGAVLQLEKSLPWQLRFIGAARLDHHSNFGDFFAPKIGLIKKVGAGNFRVTWGRAYSMPSILYQYASTGNNFFGNGEGITYIPTGAKFSDPEARMITKKLVPEEVITWEFGYKGNPFEKLFVDVSYYNGLSKNFFTPSLGVLGRAIAVGGRNVTHNPAFAGTVVNDTLKNARFTTIFNFGDVRVYGVDAGISYAFSKIVNLALRYSWIGSDITKGPPGNDGNKDGYVLADERSLNAPQNRLAAIIDLQNLFKQKAFATIATRYVQEYDFYSGNQISTKEGEGKRGEVVGPNGLKYLKNFDWGPLGGFTSVDLRAGYKFTQQISTALSITNLFDTEQREFAGSSLIRRLISIEFKMAIAGDK